MLIRFPERVAAGQTYKQPMGTVDVTPTILGLADIKTNHDFEGRNLTEQFASGGGGKGGQVTFLRNSGTNPQWVCAIDERYKLVLSVNDRPWLFTQQDPDELLNFTAGRQMKDKASRQSPAAIELHRRSLPETSAIANS